MTMLLGSQWVEPQIPNCKAGLHRRLEKPNLRRFVGQCLGERLKVQDNKGLRFNEFARQSYWCLVGNKGG